LKWKGPVFSISALTREGCEPLIRAIYEHVAASVKPVVGEVDPRFELPHGSLDSKVAADR